MITGLTWVFGFLAIDDARIVFHYIFAILNAFQGLFIFVLFTAREKQVREGEVFVYIYKNQFIEETHSLEI